MLGENTEKYITFSVPIKKKFDNGKTITYKAKYIDSFRFMSISLTSFVNNLSEGLHNYKCDDCDSYLDYISTKDGQLIFKCIECSKKHKEGFNEKLIKRFANIYEFCNRDINKFIFLLRKSVYPYEYMDSWERFLEELLPDKEDFYSGLKMEDITDVDYRHAKMYSKTLIIKI